MVTTRCLTACLAVVLSSCALAQQQHLPDGVVRYWNCDDSDGNNWRDKDWQAGGSSRVVYDTKEKREGKASLRITGSDDPKAELWVVSLNRYAEVDGGQAYVMRFFARTRDVKGEAFVRVLAHHAEGNASQPLGWVRLSPQRPEFVLPANADWRRYEIPVRNLPGNANRLFFYLGIKGAGTVWFDDFSLAKQGVDVPVGGYTALVDSDYAGIRFDDAALPTNIIKNGDFESGLQPWGVMQSSDPDASGSTAERVPSPDKPSQWCVKLTGKEFTTAYIYQQVKVDPRRHYLLSMRIRTDHLVGYCFSRVLRFNRHGQPFGWAGADHATDFCPTTGTTDGWVEQTQEFGVSPDTDSVTVYVYVSDSIGVAYVDDVRLQPLPLTDGVK